MKTDDEAILREPITKESKPRRIYITRSDISKDKYGMTPGCKGCEAINRGLHGQHDERCRARIEKELLKTPEGGLAESIAILRYLGHQCDLIPNNAFMAAKVDEFIDGISPHFSMLEGTFGIEDVEERTKAREALFLPEAKGTKGLQLLEKKIQESSTPWIAGTESMNIADLMVFTYVFGLFSGNCSININIRSIVIIFINIE